MDETVELYYPDLHIEMDYGETDWDTGRGKQWIDKDIEYTYTVDKTDVEEVILDFLPRDEYNKIISKMMLPSDTRDETDVIYEYIDNNFDVLFNRFEKKILDHFESRALDDAYENIPPEDFDYDSYEDSYYNEGLKISEGTNTAWSADLQDKFNFLKNHKRHGEHYSRDIAVWDLDLTEKQKEYFDAFTDSDAFENFWDENEKLSTDIYISGKEMNHLVLERDYGFEEPLEYDPFNFQVDDLDEAFELWCNNVYGLYSYEYAYTEEEMTDLEQEFIDWLNKAYNTVINFDSRTERLVRLFKKKLDEFIKQEEAPSDDLTETMFSEVEDIEEPELDKLNEYDEINESYFDNGAIYFVQNSRHETIGAFGDSVTAINYAKNHFRDRDASFVVKSFSIWDDEEPETPDEIIWTADEALEWGEISYEDDDFNECYNDASNELPEMEEDLDYNPDFDDDFGGHHYTSYDLYKAQQEFNDEEAFEDRDPDRYDDKHAKEWMKKHPHGWYNSESDYGVGDEEDEGPEEPLYEDLNGQILEFNNGTYFYVQKKGNSLIAGNATNTGIIPEFEIEYDEDKSEDENLQDLYDIIIEEHPEFLEENYQCNHNSLNTLEEKYFNYNKYKLPHDVVDFIVKTAEKDIDERLYFNDHDWSSMDSSETSDWVMDRIEIQFPGWKWTDENMSYVEAIVDDVMDYFLKKDTSIDESLITEATMSDLDIEIQETGYDELIDKIQHNIDDLEREERFLIRQAPREIGKGGNFDSQEDIDSALAATQRELNKEKAKLAIVRGKQNG